MQTQHYTRYLISNVSSDCPDYKYVNIRDLLSLTCLEGVDVSIRIHEPSDVSIVKHWAKRHNNVVSVLTDSPKVFTLSALFLK
jgi:hypothetical protein